MRLKSQMENSALMGILPLVFIIIEMVKLNADIEGNPEDVRDGIRTARVVACIIAALLFLYTALEDYRFILNQKHHLDFEDCMVDSLWR